MYDVDPEGLKARGGIGAKKKRRKGNFTSKGPNWVHSFDGHDKMMGYQNSTFPLAVYGWIDTASRKVLWLRIWTTLWTVYRLKSNLLERNCSLLLAPLYSLRKPRSTVEFYYNITYYVLITSCASGSRAAASLEIPTSSPLDQLESDQYSGVSYLHQWQQLSLELF